MIHFLPDLSSSRASSFDATTTMGEKGSSGSFSYQPMCWNRRRYHGNGQ